MPEILAQRMALLDETRTPGPAHWHGSLRLTLSHQDGVTRISKRQHYGPLFIQRPFYPEDTQCCHVYLLHPPGGLVGGDRLNCHFDLGPHAQALVTTPSAGKAYRVDDVERTQGSHVEINMAQHTAMEWLPQETIAFDGARLSNSTRIHFDPASALIGWEILCLGRPESGETFANGSVRQRLELWCDAKPMLLECTDYVGSGKIMQAAWGLSGRPVLGTLYAYCPDNQQRAAALAVCRELISDGKAPSISAASSVNNILLVRSLGNSTETLRALFTRIWQALRPCIIARDACIPRIWNT
jgi:urease accessory protein